ncbi:GRAM domain-containing protein [Ophiocordyceps camponoti-floridani]|uniref:GRAM domain-containing protein n=1 Tax=Ophiocordyceps camponoti-floridani TaxID=2030778 RepID=A0A8H4VD27_9HYPO|nr:GRAM domain-containing protein [Ophiocordyceps camponoti-floridani]
MDANGLGKLLPKALSTVKRKTRRNKPVIDDEANRDSTDTDLLSRTDSIDDHGRDQASLEVRDEDQGNNDDDQRRRPASDTTPPTARPAPISAHPSQIGYLTTSSPEVQANHLDSQPSSGQPTVSSSRQSRPESCDDVSPRTTALDDDDAPSRQLYLDTRQSRAPSAPITPLIVSTPPTPVESAAVVGRDSSATDKSKATTTTTTTTTTTDGVGADPGPHGSGSNQGMSALGRNKSSSAFSTIVPSKLSNTLLPSPIAENGPSSQTGGSGGFFSSVLNAAQSAASTLSSNIPGGANKSRSSLARPQTSPSPPRTEPEPSIKSQRSSEPSMDSKKESAVQTLGSGDLSLSQLGIPEPAGPTAPPVAAAAAKLSEPVDLRFRSDSAPADPQTRLESFHEDSSSRPHSLADATVGETSPSHADPDGKTSIVRASSTRSTAKPHKKRRSSVNTGSTRATAAAAMAAHGSAIQPSTSFAAPKLTGFAIASKKRNRDFHTLFRSVPDDDYLIEDYSCALHREILAHGRLYVSEGHLCFSSNILGWTTMLVMSFDEIVSVEKRSTALIFKNGLMISTLHAKHIFASFTGRDATYDLIINIWKLGHPTLKSTLNGVRLDGTGGDKTEKVDEPLQERGTRAVSESDEDSEDDDEGEDDDDDDDDDDDFYDEENEYAADTQATELTSPDAETEKSTGRKVSAMTTTAGGAVDASREAPTSPGGPADFPGPTTHAPTDCGDSATHYDKVVGDEVIAAPLGQVYNLVFGPGSVDWMAKWLTTDQKCFDLQMEDKTGLGSDHRSRNYTYIKPLNASIGPKQTKCIVAEAVDGFDIEKAVNLNVTTQTPDVPSGNVFSVKTKYCLSWAENNGTRVQVNCTTEWSGKSWLKGPIEKGVVDGQMQYCKDLFAALRTATARARAGAAAHGPGKSRKKAKKNKAQQAVDGGAERNGGSKTTKKRDWGPLEPIRGLLEPCVEMAGPVLTGNVMYGLLVGLLVAMWFGYGSVPSKSAGRYGPDMLYSPGRLAAYDEMWRREESELWEWLDERVGLDRLGSDKAEKRRQSFEDKLRDTQMDEREMEEAIRVTEEKLKVLREVADKGGRGGRVEL